MNYIFKFIGVIILIVGKVNNKLLMFIKRYQFKKVGKNVVFDSSSHFSYENIEIGDDVYIGPRAFFTTSKSVIKIGNKVLFGPAVMIIGGDHNITQIGRFMYDVKEKLPENDLPVIIQDDVWIGARVTILKGVTISKGSIVAAGSLVTKSIDPYSIVGGVPAKLIRKRFDDETLEKHIKILEINSNKKG